MVIVGDDHRREPDAGCVEPRLRREHAHVDDRPAGGGARLVEHIAEDAGGDAQALVGEDRRARRDGHGRHQLAAHDGTQQRGCSTPGLGVIDVRVRPVSGDHLGELDQLGRRVGVQVEAERDRCVIADLVADRLEQALVATWLRGAAECTVQAHDQSVDHVGVTERRDDEVAQPRERRIVERARWHRVRIEQRHDGCAAPSRLLTRARELAVRAGETDVGLGPGEDAELTEVSRANGERVALLLNEQDADVLAALEAEALEFAAAGHVPCVHRRSIIIIWRRVLPAEVQIFVALQSRRAQGIFTGHTGGDTMNSQGSQDDAVKGASELVEQYQNRQITDASSARA